MIFDEPTITHLLRGIVRCLSSFYPEHDDLVQEAHIYLWSSESQSPGMTRNWYLRGCRMHLRNVMRRGSSVDSPRHRNRDTFDSNDNIEHLPAASHAEDSSSMFSEICANELMEILARRLSPEDQTFVSLLASGLSKRAIALRLNISHTAVQKRHRRIAQIASTLRLSARSENLEMAGGRY